MATVTKVDRAGEVMGMTTKTEAGNFIIVLNPEEMREVDAALFKQSIHITDMVEKMENQGTDVDPKYVALLDAVTMIDEIQEAIRKAKEA